ncbi:MAG: SDR family NAD(P)-dependent oxidoreductase, partial [Solirubrobacteraceae bacterium]
LRRRARMRIEKSRPVLITGCSTGIGRATAERLAEEGYNVHATARRLESIEDLAGRGMKTHALDVADEASMEAAVTEVEKEGPVGALVNNAGYSQSGAIETVSMADVQRQFQTNVFGLIELCQLVLPGMRAQRFGKIVNVSSMGANFTFPGGGLYHASKYALEAISDALRFEVAGFGVDVIVLQPGLIHTRFGQAASASMESLSDSDTSDDDEDPYSRFNATVAHATAAVYENPRLAIIGGPPEAVAKKIQRAISARRPRTRYRVTPSARLLITQRKLVSDRVWDRLMRAQFPRPGK